MRKLLSTIVLAAIAIIAMAQANPMEGLCFNPDKVAEFPGGKIAMNQYFSENLEYPMDALAERVEGRVMCQFIVMPDSSRTNVNIVRKVHPSIDAEMLRLVENMPQWAPALKDGVPVKTLVTLPLMFKLPEGLDINEGTLPGVFTVSSDKKVRFSKGNLQYQPSTRTWRFAEQQWETIGVVNDIYQTQRQRTGFSMSQYMDFDIVPTSLCPNKINHELWLDLFWFGSSGKNNFYPEEKCDEVKMIKPDKDTDYDWGRYCSIINGGNKAGLWRTLTAEEWNYLFNERANAKKLFGFIILEGIKGLVLLPDNYINVINDEELYPTRDSSLSKKGNNYYNKNKNNFDSAKEVSLANWVKMQEAGAIFLPNVELWLVEEIRYEGDLTNVYSRFGYGKQQKRIENNFRLANEGFYWSWTRKGMAYNCLNFNNEFIYTQAIKENIYRLPVRLVKDVE